MRLSARAAELYGRLGGKEFVRQGRPLLVATGLASFAVYGFHFYVSRRLGVDQYGTIASLLSAVTLVNAAAAVGATVLARFAADFRAVDDRGRLRRLLDLVTRWSAIAAAIAVLGAFALRLPLAGFMNLHTPAYVVLAVALACLTVVAVLLRGMLQGMQQFVSFSLSFIAEQVGRALLAALCVAAGFGVAGALGGGIAAAAIASVYTYAGLRGLLRVPAVNLRIDVRRLVATTGAIAAATVGLAMLSYLDVVLAKHYLDPRSAGLYGFAVLPGRALTAIISFVPTWIFPKAAEHAAEGRNGHAPLAVGLGVATLLALPVLALLYFFAPQIAALAGGPQFEASAPLMLPYACAATVFTLASIAATYQMGRHQFRFVTPLAAAVAVEVGGIALLHGTAEHVVYAVLIANVAAFLAALFGLRSRR